jgi:hypothetical protein
MSRITEAREFVVKFYRHGQGALSYESWIQNDSFVKLVAKWKKYKAEWSLSKKRDEGLKVIPGLC